MHLLCVSAALFRKMTNSTSNALKGHGQKSPTFVPMLAYLPPLNRPTPVYVEQDKYDLAFKTDMNMLKNTKLCTRYLAKGYCNKRDCTFAHSVVGLYGHRLCSSPLLALFLHATFLLSSNSDCWFFS